MIDEALAVARCGLRTVFSHSIGADGRCTCGRASCPERSWGKHPILKAWQKVATDDPEALRTQYDGIRFVPNVSVVLGPQRDGRYLVAVDVDDADRMRVLEAEHGGLPTTCSGMTPRGRRLFFALPSGAPSERVKNITGIGGKPGVDLKAAGGQVVVYGRNAGGVYAGFDPHVPIAELPVAWVLAILEPPKPPPDVHKYTPHSLREDARSKKRYEKYLDKAISGECMLLSRTAEGQRNAATYRAAFKLLSLANGMHLTSTWGHVRSEVERAAVAAGLPAGEARRTIASAEKAIVDSGAVRVPREVSPVEEPSPPSYEPDAPRVEVRLIEDGGSPAKIAENVARMLVLHPRGVPRMNRLKEQAEWPDGSTITDVDELDIQGWLVSQPHSQRVRVGIEAVHGGIQLAANRNAYEPVQNYLSGLVWDRKPRIAKAGETYFGTDVTTYAESVMRCFFIGAVARAMQPGCQLDTMLILEGEQGTRKSSALATLAGPNWFSNSQLIIGREPDCYQKLRGVWIYELGEVDNQLRYESKQEEIKGYITSRVDQYRPSYGRNIVRVPRRNAFVGSTNRTGYLVDDTGGRRYHALRTTVVRLEEIERDRNQLWAEAMCLFRAGEPWWLNEASATAAAKEVEKRYLSDPWEDLLPRLLADVDVVTTAEMLKRLGVDPAKFDRALSTKAGIALRRAGGWIRVEAVNALGLGERFHYRRDSRVQPR